MKKSIFLLLSALLISPLLYADIKAGSIGLTLGEGEEFFDEQRHLNNTNISIVAASYQFSQYWGIEGFAGFFSTTYKPIANYHRSVIGSVYLLDGTYHFLPNKRLSPYVTAGIGMSSIDSDRFDATNEGNVNASLGLRYAFDEVVSLRIEAKDIYTFVGSKNDVLVFAGLTFSIYWC
jgi:outer membrane protein with beta-barrel domain